MNLRRRTFIASAAASAASFRIGPIWAQTPKRSLSGIPIVAECETVFLGASAYALGAACDALWTLLPLRGDPPMTRFLAEQLGTSHWYSMAPAARDFGYVPKVSMAEGLERLRRTLHR